MLEVPLGDELACGVSREPSLAMAQELRDLVVTDEIVLVVVKDGDEHVEVREQVADLAGGSQGDPEVGALPPVGEGWVEVVSGRLDGVAERLEEATHEVLATAGRKARDGCLQRDGGVDELGAV